MHFQGTEPLESRGFGGCLSPLVEAQTTALQMLRAGPGSQPGSGSTNCRRRQGNTCWVGLARPEASSTRKIGVSWL